MATRSEYRKNYRNYADKATEVYHEHLRYRQLRRSAEFAHHEWAWANVECDDSATPSGASAAPATAAAPTPEKPPTVAKTQLQTTELLPLSKRLTKAKPSLSTVSQSGSETDYEEREADVLGDPLAESGGEEAAKRPVNGQTKPLSEEAERAKIRRAIRQIKQQRQEQQQQTTQQRKQSVEKLQRQERQQPRRPPHVVENLAYSSGVAEENGYDDYEESEDSTDADYEEQLAVARRRRLQRRHRQRQEEQKKLHQADAKQHPVDNGAALVPASKKKPKKQQQRRRQVPDCPPLELDRVAEESAQALFHRQGPSQQQQQQHGQQQQQAESPPIFYPWGMGDQEREYGLKRTFNVRATRDVYDSALRARARCPPPPPRPRPATAGGGPVASAGGRVGGLRPNQPGDNKAARDDYWLSEYAKNFAKYANALYARNRQSLASRSRADFL